MDEGIEVSASEAQKRLSFLIEEFFEVCNLLGKLHHSLHPLHSQITVEESHIIYRVLPYIKWRQNKEIRGNTLEGKKAFEELSKRIKKETKFYKYWEFDQDGAEDNEEEDGT